MIKADRQRYSHDMNKHNKENRFECGLSEIDGLS
jgi:hypothetical protein